MNKWYLFLLYIIATQQIAFSQISTESVPASFNSSFSSPISIIEIPNIVPNPLRIDVKGPKQAGYILPFTYNLSKNGSWEYINHEYIWRLEIVVPDALSMNFYLSNINLSPGEKLYVYDLRKRFVLGAFTSRNNALYMSTDFIPGDSVIIEFNSQNRYEQLPFSLHEIGILFNNDLFNSKGFGDAGNCEVHINCIEGEDWQDEKDGVARVLVKQNSSTFWCTGSLINNTNNDGTPYFLTANHCGESADSADYAQWLFYFKFESENCQQPVFEPASNILAGAKLIARAPQGTTAGSDFKLLLLKDSIPSEYKPYYNGWDIAGNASNSGVTIHHPQGDVKMISTYESALLSTRYNNQNEDPEGKYWMVHWDKTLNGHGVTEGGSSGSPLFDGEGYIVGALTGGYASCANLDAPDYYGKLNASWEPIGSDSSSQLKYWLDPTNSGVSSLKGNNLDSTSIFAGFSGEPTQIIMGESVYFINTSYGNINAYSWYFEGGYPNISELKEPKSVKYDNAGQFSVRLIVKSAESIDTLTRVNYIKVLPNISPNPSNGIIKLAFGGTIPADILNSIRIFNVIGQEISYRLVEKSGNYIMIEILPTTHGLFFVNINSEEINSTFKVIIY